MSNVTLFGNRSSTAMALLKDLDDDLTNKIAGSGGLRRISFEGNVFREIIGGKEVRVSEDRAMQIVVVSAAAVGRTYYSGSYVKGQKAKPVCWSSDTQKPDGAVPEGQRQANFCKDCPQNIKGSAAQGEGRACRYSQRLAVLLAGDNGVDTNIYQVSLPATSVFGDAEGQKMPLQAYGRYLKAHNTHIITVVTEMRFDTAGQMKLVFKPVRSLTDEELAQVVPMRDHPDAIKAITMSVSNFDRNEDEPFETPKEAAPKPVAKVEKVEVEEVIEEPKKVAKKSAPASVPEEKVSLDTVFEEWDD